MASRTSVPPSYGMVIAMIGLLGLPSSLFVVALLLNQNAWVIGIEATGFSSVVFYWAVVHLAVIGYLVYRGLEQIARTEIPKKCKKCKQIQCVCE